MNNHQNTDCKSAGESNVSPHLTLRLSLTFISFIYSERKKTNHIAKAALYTLRNTICQLNSFKYEEIYFSSTNGDNKLTFNTVALVVLD